MQDVQDKESGDALRPVPTERGSGERPKHLPTPTLRQIADSDTAMIFLRDGEEVREGVRFLKEKLGQYKDTVLPADSALEEVVSALLTRGYNECLNDAH